MSAQGVTGDIITQLREKAGGGSKAEQRLAALILRDIDYATRTSIVALAAEAGVSEPTVTRLAVSMGYAGTRELKLQLARAQALGGAFIRSQGNPIELGKAHSVAAVCAGIEAIAASLRETTDEALLLEVARLITGAGLVNIYGIGGISSLLATEFQFRLFRLGIKVVAYGDGPTQKMTAAVADKSTVAIGLSVSGRSQSVIDALAITRRYGGRAIAITQPGSPLAARADILVPFEYLEDGNYYKPSSSRYKLMALVDMIALLAAEAIGPAALEKMRRMKLSLDSDGQHEPPWPLGD